MKKSFFGWDNFKMLFKEWVYTFSNKKSLLSSKRIERAILFLVSVSMSCGYVWYNRATISVWEMLGVVGALMGYAGFNTVQTMKEKTNKSADAPKDTPNAPVEQSPAV